MVNRIFAQEGIAAFRADDICCQKTAISFVDAIFETLGPLSQGRPLVQASAAEAKDIQKLGLLIERHAVTRLITVPSLARALLESAEVVRCLASLRNWTLSGEELAPDLLLQLRRQLPDCTFINLYGSSEVAADATGLDGSHFAGDRVPIGRPMANTQAYILDRRLQPVPIGVVGEIFIGGAGIARGYLNRPELTAERFIADPFSRDPRARLYKSGDLGRRRADGALEYLGRRDSQVKLRGLRIELREIEEQLLRQRNVKEAVVTGWEATPGEKRLVAYLTWHDHGQLQEPSPDGHDDRHLEDLRTHLWAVLPEYMIPSAFITLDTMPRTPGGKVDLRALPIPDPDAYRGRKYAAPCGKIEEALAQIWQELLGVSQVGREDNFFELGGHSLLGMKLVAGVAQRLGMQPAVVTIFQYPTIRQMAQLVATLLSHNSAPADAAAELDGTVL
jgi:acyl-coenzyme A synthetase/AMP-(fatty) acid ligase